MESLISSSVNPSLSTLHPLSYHPPPLHHYYPHTALFTTMPYFPKHPFVCKNQTNPYPNPLSFSLQNKTLRFGFREDALLSPQHYTAQWKSKLEVNIHNLQSKHPSIQLFFCKRVNEISCLSKYCLPGVVF